MSLLRLSIVAVVSLVLVNSSIAEFVSVDELPDTIVFEAKDAELTGSYKLSGNRITDITMDGSIKWSNVKVPEGKYVVSLMYAARSDRTGGEIAVRIGDKVLEHVIRRTRRTIPEERRGGIIEITATEFDIEITPRKMAHNLIMNYLSQIVFTPVVEAETAE